LDQRADLFAQEQANKKLGGAIGGFAGGLGALAKGMGEDGDFGWKEAIGGAAALAPLISLSDRRLKKNIKKANKETDSFLDSLKSYSYDYKDQSHGKGKQLSVMAQDLEKTRAGKRSVVDVKGVGKAVDYSKLLPALVAGVARLNEKVSRKG
jgi:hypothetical protein